MNNPIIVSDDVRNIAYAYNLCVVLSEFNRSSAGL